MRKLGLRRRIEQLYACGLTIKEVAQEVGLSPKTVSRYLSKKRPHAETVRLASMRRRAELAKQARLLYDSGYTVEEIARLWGKHWKTIKRLLELTGVQNAQRRAPLGAILESRKRMRSAWELVEIEGKSVKEASRILRMNPETVKAYVRLYRGVLRRAFGELPPELLKKRVYQEYYVKGRSAVEVARQFRMNVNLVMEYARQYAKERGLQAGAQTCA